MCREGARRADAEYKIRRTARRVQRATRDKSETGDLVSDRMEFEIDCPNDHNQTVTFTREGFEEAMKSGPIVFHCNTCDTNWQPSHQDIARFRKQLASTGQN